MSQTRKNIRIFVSSPDDMRQEREQLGEIVQSMNRSWGHFFKFQFELIRWETHGVPGFGEDAQDVLNKELPNDFEVYIGLMWCRFGHLLVEPDLEQKRSSTTPMLDSKKILHR